MDSPPPIDPRISAALPQGLFLMTAAADQASFGFLTPWVQQCGEVPFLVSVTIQRGSSIEPILRDSRHFALCAVDPSDRLIQRRFGEPIAEQEDAFVGLPHFQGPSGSPVLRRSTFYLDCELAGHMAMESDCRIYIGQVIAAGLLDAPDVLKSTGS